MFATQYLSRGPGGRHRAAPPALRRAGGASIGHPRPLFRAGDQGDSDSAREPRPAPSEVNYSAQRDLAITPALPGPLPSANGPVTSQRLSKALSSSTPTSSASHEGAPPPGSLCLGSVRFGDKGLNIAGFEAHLVEHPLGDRRWVTGDGWWAVSGRGA